MTVYADKSLREIANHIELRHRLLYLREPYVHAEIPQRPMSLGGT